MQVELETVKQIIVDFIETRIDEADIDNLDGYTTNEQHEGAISALTDLRDLFGDSYIEEELERLSHTHEKAPDSSES